MGGGVREPRSCQGPGGGGDKVSNSASGNLGGAGALLWDLSGTEAVGERPQRSLLFRSLFPLQQRSLTLSPVLAKIVSLDL